MNDAPTAKSDTSPPTNGKLCLQSERCFEFAIRYASCGFTSTLDNSKALDLITATSDQQPAPAAAAAKAKGSRGPK